MSDPMDWITDVIEKQTAASRAMFAEGRRIGRREALAELRMAAIHRFGHAFPEHIAMIDDILEKDTAQFEAEVNERIKLSRLGVDAAQEPQ